MASDEAETAASKAASFVSKVPSTFRHGARLNWNPLSITS
jgi:hypothetical protein